MNKSSHQSAQKKPVLFIVIGLIAILAIAVIIKSVGGSEFDKRTSKYGFNTEEKRNFLCISMMSINPDLNVRMGSAAVMVAYSRYLQKQRGNDTHKILPEHNDMALQAMRSWEKMSKDDLRYIADNCLKRMEELAPKMATELNETFRQLGM